MCAILYNMKREIIEQTRTAILQHIAEKGIREGDTIPSIRQLQAVLLTSKNATLEALQSLCGEGFLEKGSGARNGYLLRRLPDGLSAVVSDRADGAVHAALQHLELCGKSVPGPYGE